MEAKISRAEFSFCPDTGYCNNSDATAYFLIPNSCYSEYDQRTSRWQTLQVVIGRGNHCDPAEQFLIIYRAVLAAGGRLERLDIFPPGGALSLTEGFWDNQLLQVVPLRLTEDQGYIEAASWEEATSCRVVGAATWEGKHASLLGGMSGVGYWSFDHDNCVVTASSLYEEPGSPAGGYYRERPLEQYLADLARYHEDQNSAALECGAIKVPDLQAHLAPNQRRGHGRQTATVPEDNGNA
ncbi:hypothetical protein [Gloeobacter morelensis]|uniref:hypothetical protein n=1 Tax=Gloeobacter morelensis TaxID=2907343 RepID=UPI001E438387|nr:hypothetical protein [Gloeobacter morelensis]UFP97281.1 hypothetical protein ISF26_24475 [Gloeobacter morelensis MG652769]